MKSTSAIRKTAKPIMDRSATSSPQLGPISFGEMSCSGSTPVTSTIVCSI